MTTKEEERANKTSQIKELNELALDARNQSIRLISKELDTGNRIGAELPQRLNGMAILCQGSLGRTGHNSMIDVPDIQTDVIADFVKAAGQQAVGAEGDGIAITLIADGKRPRSLVCRALTETQ